MTDSWRAELHPAVRDAVDKQQIHDVLMRYFRGIDRADEELIRSAYHPDGYDDHGWFRGLGWDFAAAAAEKMRRLDQSCLHQGGTEIIEVDGDTARSETYHVAVRRDVSTDPAKDFSFAGRYIDRFERRDGEWRIVHRVVVIERTRVDPVPPEVHPSSLVGMALPHRSREDLCYGGEVPVL